MDQQAEKKTSIPVDEPAPTPPSEPVETEIKPMPKMPVVGLLVILLILALGAVVFLVYQNMQLQKQITGIQNGYQSPGPVAYASPTSSPAATSLPNNSDDILQTIKDLTQPMVWSTPQADTYKNSSGQTLSGKSMTVTIPSDKNQNKVAPFFASSSVLTTNYGWTLGDGASGTTGEWVTFKKTNGNSIQLLLISLDSTKPQYYVFVSDWY